MVVIDALTYSGHRESMADVEADERFEFIHADICDAEAMACAFARCSPTVLINFAAETHVDRSIDDPWPWIVNRTIDVSFRCKIDQDCR